MAAKSLVLRGILAHCCRNLFIRWLLFRTFSSLSPGFQKQEITEAAINRQVHETLARNRLFTPPFATGEPAFDL